MVGIRRKSLRMQIKKALVELRIIDLSKTDISEHSIGILIANKIFDMENLSPIERIKALEDDFINKIERNLVGAIAALRKDGVEVYKAPERGPIQILSLDPNYKDISSQDWERTRNQVHAKFLRAIEDTQYKHPEKLAELLLGCLTLITKSIEPQLLQQLFKGLLLSDKTEQTS